MWFVFPQPTDQGINSATHHYAIASREEAAAFLGHRLLLSRLSELALKRLTVREAWYG
jgi:uncharacterized protein (DUF1810 family)